MEKFKEFIDVFEKLKYILSNKQLKQSALIFFLIILNGICDMLGISVIVPFVQAVLTPELLWGNIFVSKIAHLLRIETNQGIIIFLGVCIVGVFVLKNGFLIVSNYIQIRFRTRVKKELSVEMMNSYMNRPYTFFLDTNTSDVISGVGHWVDCTYVVLENVFYLFSNIVKILVITAYIFVTDAALAIGVLLIAVIVVVSLVMVFKPKMKQAGIVQRDAIITQSKWAIQSINGIKDIKVTNRGDKFLKKYDMAYEVRRKAELMYNFLAVCPNPIIETLAISGIVIIICIKMSMGIDMTRFIPTLVALALAIIMILPSISGLLSCINQIIFNKPAMNKAYNNLKEEREQKENKVEVEKNLVHVDELKDKVELKDISWTYPNSEKCILNDLQLTIHKGEAIALIGTSGGGKTTLADIILGLLHPQKGSVKIDGIDTRLIGGEWNQLIGYVPQTVYLLDDTIRENILFGLDYDENTDEKIWKVLEQAQLSEFVKSLPLGLDTVVGERGIKFSGGQRQRIAIARALYYSPEILILDEATSALDNDTEKAVMEAIESLQGKLTMIIIAHRLETIKKCDTIFEIKEGKAVKRGKEEVFEIA